MTGLPARYATHDDAAWRSRADFIINAPLAEPRRFEQLWTRRIAGSQFEICCIPFFLYGVALGDIVQTSKAGSHEYVLDRVLERSGRHVYRVHFEQAGFNRRRDLEVEMTQIGAMFEWSSASLVAIDATAEQAPLVRHALEFRSSSDAFSFEVGAD